MLCNSIKFELHQSVLQCTHTQIHTIRHLPPCHTQALPAHYATRHIRHFYFIISCNIFICFSLLRFSIRRLLVCVRWFMPLSCFRPLTFMRAFYLLLLFFPHFFACFVYITLFCTTWRTMATRNTKGTSKRKKDFIYICEKKEI